MFTFPVFRKLPAACLLGYSLLWFTACEDFVVGSGGGSASSSDYVNPSRGDLERQERMDEKRYGPRVKKRTIKVLRDPETGAIIDPALAPTISARKDVELEDADVIKQDIIDEPSAMNIKKKSKAATPAMEPLTPSAETTTEETTTTTTEVKTGSNSRSSRPVLPPPSVEPMTPELMEPPVPSPLR